MSTPQTTAEFLESMRARFRDFEPPRSLEHAQHSVESQLSTITSTFAEIQAKTYQGMTGAEGDDDRVVAEVDGRGTLIRLDITPRAMRDLDAEALGLACTEAIANARQCLAIAFADALPQPGDLADPRPQSGERDQTFAGRPGAFDLADIFRQAKEMTWPTP